MRVIVTGGGTGGHIYPALAIADKIKEMDPESQILYVGNEEGIEKEIVPGTGYDFKMVTARWLDKITPGEIIKTGMAVSKGISQSKKIIKEFKPQVIIGTGGFVCFPMLLAGHKLKCRTYIHEQNAFPGLANRALERYVDNIFLGFADGAEYFKEKDKLIVAGNPVRKTFFEITRKEARRKLGIPEEDFVIFSFGGSLGAKKINEIAFQLMELFNGHKGVTMIIGTGKWMYDDAVNMLKEKDIVPGENIRLKGYIDNMDLHLLACDLVISRAGALSVAETTVCGKAAIFVPYPYATGNHQYYNAKSVADRGGAVIIDEDDLIMEDVIEKVLSLKNDAHKLEEMSQASRQCAPDHALDIIYDKINENYIKDGHKDK